MDYTGSSNEAELHGKLKNLMVRRLKSDVLHELPPKQRSILQTSMSVKEKSNCESAMKELKASREPVDQQLVSRSADSKLMAAYQATGIGKASSVAAFVLDWLAGTEKQKILVFAHHKAVLDTIDNAILEKRPNSHIRIDGNVPTAIRAQLVRKFQTCDRVRVALLSMTAAGVGLTLTAASTVLFAELHWTPGVLAQCEDRAHRIGQQHDSVQILYSICKDEKLSLDSTLWNLLGKKIGTLDQVVDGKDDKPYLFNARDEDGLQAGVTSGGGISVQEELTSFFAESSVAESSKAKKKPPAKGSIESYFQKAKSNDKATTSKATNPVEASKSDWRFRLSQPRLATQPFASWKCQHCTLLNPNSVKICKACNREKGGSDDDNVTWNCSKCTLENQRSGSASGLYYCELCSGPYCHGQATEASSASTNATASAASANVSTRTAGASNAQASVGAERKSCLSVDSDSDSDLEELLQIRTFSGKRTARKPKSDKMPAQAHRATETISMVDEPTNSYEASRKEKQVHSEVIVIDDEPITAFTRSQPKRVTMSPEVIDLLGDDDSVDEQPSKRPRKKQGGQPVGTVAFTVSANTGRISVHFDDNELSSFNFSLDDVLDAETSDFLLRAQAKRAPSVNASSLSIKFNLRGIKTVCQNLERSGHHVPRTFEYDVMAFVSEYLKLREIEKKAFANAGRPTRAADFSRVVAALLIQTAKGTDRYIGGAKERARERLEEGTASDVDMAVLDGRACAWCSGRLSSASLSAESTYCSQECAEEGRLRRGGMYSGVQIRSAVFALEQGKCTLCGIDCHALFEQIRSLEPPSRLNKLLSVNWKLPQSAKACDRLLNDPKEGDFWQVDHIRAVALGGGGCGLENLRTLCVPCHLLETERLRGSLRLKSPPRGDSEESSKRKQTQISDFISKKPKAAARNN